MAVTMAGKAGILLVGRHGFGANPADPAQRHKSHKRLRATLLHRARILLLLRVENRASFLSLLFLLALADLLIPRGI